MKNLTFLLCLFYMLIFCACGDRYEDTNIENYLNKIAPGTQFTLDQNKMNLWDTLYIVKPYSYNKIKEFNLQIPKKHQKFFEVIASVDNFCILIFTKDKRMVSFAEVPRSIGDFSFLDGVQYPAKQVFSLDNDRRVLLLL